MVYLIRGMQETNSVYVERVLSTSQMFHQLTSHQENVAGKHHCLVVKDIEDVIAKHRAEVTFVNSFFTFTELLTGNISYKTDSYKRNKLFVEK